EAREGDGEDGRGRVGPPRPGHQPDQGQADDEHHQRADQAERHPGQAEHQLTTFAPGERRDGRRAGERSRAPPGRPRAPAPRPPPLARRACRRGGGPAAGGVTARPSPLPPPPPPALPPLPPPPPAHASRRPSSPPPIASATAAYTHSTSSPAHADRKCGHWAG